MLSKKRRIPRGLFLELNKARKLSHSPHFSLRMAQDNHSLARVAVTVSKKVSKSAVRRNKVRRRTYSAIRDHLDALDKGLYLFIAKKGSEMLKIVDIEQEVSQLLKPFERG